MTFETAKEQTMYRARRCGFPALAFSPCERTPGSEESYEKLIQGATWARLRNVSNALKLWESHQTKRLLAAE